MKTIFFFPRGPFVAALASAAVISPAFGQLFHRTPRPAEVAPPTVIREERVVEQPRPLLRPEPEPQIIEIIPESEARAREKRAKQSPDTRALPPGTTIIEERVVPKAIDAEREGTVEVRKPSTRVSSSRKSSETAPQEQQSVMEERKRSTHASTAKKSSEPVSEEQVVTESPKKAPKRSSSTERTEVSSTEKRETDEAQREIEQLQKKVNELQTTVAETKKETVVDAPPSTAPAPDVTGVPPVPRTPLPVGPNVSDTRQPLVVDTPPEIKTENTTVKTETSTSAAPETKEKIVEKTSKGERTGSSASTEKPGNLENIPTKSDAPVATKTDKPGFVTSPFPPHNVIDATGLPKGSLAKDPSTNKVFRVP